ncbi:MAG: Glycosyltransferase [Candidatus Woesebacteria bacterium GW2011_GWA2_40_7b]|uniref:Glycosyltransferase n=1 Tax=Candidatus Woesebacteria bacterium GW2011_GWA2_40_7b TaxID=1618563 RepID=A0A0G0T2Z4_9BACT|nr:MAG: Glycosyltransferase [Candidatus Woesebacteria bacterium GW2011_GWA2_40_7b]
MIPDLNMGKELYYEHINRYQFAGGFVKKKKVLDLACGSGYGSKMLSSAGANNVVGLDISRTAIEYAESKYGHDNINFCVGDALKTDLVSGSFDVVVSFEFIEHIIKQNDFIIEIKRLLKSEGILIISTPNKTTYSDKNKFHKKELNAKEFKEILMAHFKYVEMLGQFFWFSNFVIPEKSELVASGSVPSHSGNNSQYLIAICSDKKIENVIPSFVAGNDIDGMDVTQGIQPLGKLMTCLQNETTQLREELEKIKASKTYKLWRYYLEVKSKVLGKKND